MQVALRMNGDSRGLPGAKGIPKGARKILRPSKDCDLALELTVISRGAKKRNLQELDGMLEPHVPVLSSSVTVTIAEQARWLKHPERLVGIGAVPTLLQGSVIECVSPGPEASIAANAAIEFSRQLGKETVFVHDAAGLVFPRILSMLANEAMFAAADNVAAPPDIDTAMQLGVNYPHGPLAWAEQIGMNYVRAILVALGQAFGEERYRLAPQLRQTRGSKSTFRITLDAQS
jgi:3-hydroxybutyryl-CoA dehydrogenase